MDKTYELKRTEHVQIKHPKGGLDQRFCSALLTFRAVGPQNVPPMLVFPLQPFKERKGREVIKVDPFRATNKVTRNEQKEYDNRVVVVFDPTMLASIDVMVPLPNTLEIIQE